MKRGVLNKGAVERAIRFGLAVNGKINRRSVFARKNYFYPDLPKGYQISQYELPIVEGGTLDIVVGEQPKTVRLTRAHLVIDCVGRDQRRLATPPRLTQTEKTHDVAGIFLRRT